MDELTKIVLGEETASTALAVRTDRDKLLQELELAREFFGTISMGIGNYTYNATGRSFSSYGTYRDLQQLRSSIVSGEERIENDFERNMHRLATQLVGKIEAAMATTEDYGIVGFIDSFRELTSKINSCFFFAHAGMEHTTDVEEGVERVNQTLQSRSRDVIPHYQQTSAYFNGLSPEKQREVVEWLGEVCYLVIDRSVTQRFSVSYDGNGVAVQQSMKKTLPDLNQTVEDYIAEHRTEKPEADLRTDFFAQFGYKILSHLGIEPKEEEQESIGRKLVKMLPFAEYFTGANE